jgi:hypothetical protein
LQCTYIPTSVIREGGKGGVDGEELGVIPLWDGYGDLVKIFLWPKSLATSKFVELKGLGLGGVTELTTLARYHFFVATPTDDKFTGSCVWLDGAILISRRCRVSYDDRSGSIPKGAECVGARVVWGDGSERKGLVEIFNKAVTRKLGKYRFELRASRQDVRVLLKETRRKEGYVSNNN